MALHRFQKGELGHWLRTVADNAQPGAAQAEIPADIAQALQTLRCIEADDDGRWRITDKACWPCAWKARRHPSALRRRIGAGRSIPKNLANVFQEGRNAAAFVCAPARHAGIS